MVPTGAFLCVLIETALRPSPCGEGLFCLCGADAAFEAEAHAVVGPATVFVDGWAGVGFAAGHEGGLSGGPLADHVGCGGEWCGCWWRLG